MSQQTGRKRVNWMEGRKKAGAQNETATCTLLFVCARQPYSDILFFDWIQAILSNSPFAPFFCSEVSKLSPLSPAVVKLVWRGRYHDDCICIHAALLIHDFHMLNIYVLDWNNLVGENILITARTTLALLNIFLPSVFTFAFSVPPLFLTGM